MTSNIQRYKSDINKLVKTSESIFKKLQDDKHLSQYRQDYEIWYSQAVAIIKVVLPDRLHDFSKMYYDDKKKSGLKTHFQFTPPTIQKGFDLEYFGERIIPPKEIDLAKAVFDSQIGILKSCEKRFENSLFDIKQLLQSDLFTSELDAANELNKKGFSRGAGAVAGVVLEGHLKQVCENHALSVRKANPTINDFNQLLKDNDVIEIPTWRFIQHLGDLRNLCDHKKQNEPTSEEISELIKGVDKVCKTLY